jgi:hypothetical protein
MMAVLYDAHNLTLYGATIAQTLNYLDKVTSFQRWSSKDGLTGAIDDTWKINLALLFRYRVFVL